MDEAEVFLNGVRVGEHAGAFTPFTFDVSNILRAADNVLAVRVVDYAGSDERHGKRTYVSEFGLTGARELAGASHRKARAALEHAAGWVSGSTRDLEQITDFIATRTS